MSRTSTIPENWDAVTIGDLLDLSNGINADKVAYGSGIPFANVLEVITNETLQDWQIPGRINLPCGVTKRYAVRHGDVLFNRTSETQDEVGLSSVYLGSGSPVFGGFVFRGRRKNAKLRVDYSAFALRGHSVRHQIVARGQGGIRANVGQRDLKAVQVILPPPDEQAVIADVLADASDLVTCLKRLLRKKREIKQGLAQHLLTGRGRLAGFSQPWEEMRLGDVASMGSGGTPPSSNDRYYGGGIPWVSISDMTKAGKYVRATEKTLSASGLANSAAKLYDKRAVLYAMYASLGECALPVGAMSSSQAILGILPGKRLDRGYLYYHLSWRKARVRELGQHGTQSNLNAGMVRDFRIPLPEKNEQCAIASVLADADADIAVLSAKLAKAENLKTGMMQNLLTGAVRLPVLEAAA